MTKEDRDFVEILMDINRREIKSMRVYDIVFDSKSLPLPSVAPKTDDTDLETFEEYAAFANFQWHREPDAKIGIVLKRAAEEFDVSERTVRRVLKKYGYTRPQPASS